MGNKRKVASTDPKSTQKMRGLRLAGLRGSLRLSRAAFFKKFGISASTLQNWEDGKYGGLTEKGTRRVIAALRSIGVNCTSEWLLYGIEPAPTIADPLLGEMSLTPPPPPKSAAENNNELMLIAKELKVFRENHPHLAMDMVVADDGMEPYYHAGEYIAGVKCFGEEIAVAIGHDCIVQTNDGEVLLRHVKKGSAPHHYMLVCANPHTTVTKPILYDVPLMMAAPILWVRRKRL